MGRNKEWARNLYYHPTPKENDRFRIIGRYYGVISLKLAQ
nr:MAG TPA: hypothetical protein [Caudoviricetes sp.]